MNDEKPKIYKRQSIGINLEPGVYYYCNCGKSADQPFCDNSHKGTEFKPVIYKAEETKEIYFCVCKQTNNQPFCDGSHSK